MLKRGGDMVKMESVTIKVPAEMKKYIVDTDAETDLVQNALLLYPYITWKSGRNSGNKKIRIDRYI